MMYRWDGQIISKTDACFIPSESIMSVEGSYVMIYSTDNVRLMRFGLWSPAGTWDASSTTQFQLYPALLLYVWFQTRPFQVLLRVSADIIAMGAQKTVVTLFLYNNTIANNDFDAVVSVEHDGPL